MSRVEGANFKHDPVPTPCRQGQQAAQHRLLYLDQKSPELEA